jgi:hypothetical protein
VNRFSYAMRRAGIAVLLSILQSASWAAAPDAGDLARCAQIAAPDARLACFDALSAGAKRAVPAAAAKPAPAPGTAAPSAAAVTSAPSAAPASPSAVPPAVAPAVAPSAPAAAASATDPRNFGLTQTQIRPVAQGPGAIQARISKIINTRYGSNSVVLDNGETWVYTDSDQDARLSPGDQVTIKRALLGSFLMQTPSKNSYHVRRTQ